MSSSKSGKSPSRTLIPFLVILTLAVGGAMVYHQEANGAEEAKSEESSWTDWFNEREKRKEARKELEAQAKAHREAREELNRQIAAAEAREQKYREFSNALSTCVMKMASEYSAYEMDRSEKDSEGGDSS